MADPATVTQDNRPGRFLPTLTSRPIPRWLTTLFWLNLACQVGIVVTGGLVRLTGSGLGCPEWPRCTADSIAPTRHQEESWHKYVEFGNRTLTGVLSIVALALLVGIVKGAPTRKGLRLPTALVLGGIALQAIVGGITVLTGLNPAIVAAHFMISMLLVAASAWLVWRGREGDAPARTVVRPGILRLGQGIAAFTGVVLVLGTLVTGSGPHSGDADEPARLGLDPRTISWIHADAVMLYIGLIVAMIVAVRLTAKESNAPRAWGAVLVITLLQGAIGYVQYFTGLPWLVVLLHMLGASVLVVAVTWAVLSLRVREDV
ncbi:heme A synthase [Yimella sp. cx-51]|nr:heme A synthase [Yimella sp. cx-51]MBD2760287.1 heme A synthase [Yimella sp. cx-573]QTH39566.1 heme A synthase [Yimella sp. cx-51]